MRLLKTSTSLVLILVVAFANADDLDDLFDSPPADKVVVDTGLVPLPVPTEPVRPFLNASGWTIAATDGKSYSGYFGSTVLGGIDFRPDNILRFYTSISTILPNETNRITFSIPKVAEIFADYSLGDWAILRVGQFALTWGQTRLVTNEANLVSTLATGVTGKGSFPLPGGGLTLLVSGQGKLDANKAPETILSAAQLDQTWGPLTMGFSGSYLDGQIVAPLWKGASYARTSFAGADLYVETVGIWKEKRPKVYKLVGNAGFLWQGGFPVWTVNGEYQLVKVDDNKNNDGSIVELAVSLDSKRTLGFAPKVLWTREWRDHSGQLIPTVSMDLSKGVGLTIGLPWTYGDPGTHFVIANDDPQKRRFVMAAKVSWAWSY